VIIFIGPTGVGMDLTGLEVRPPAQQGDITAAVLDGAKTIVLIDGYFSQNLSPWHKEILFAIENGCRVIGAASLGALRAIECERYGMEKAGVICDWYLDGTCTDDSEVALAHSDEADGYRHLSVPLVNIIATAYHLRDERKTVIHSDEFINTLKDVFYMERSWGKIKSLSQTLYKLLKENYVNQKQIDAYEAIELAKKDKPVIKSAVNAFNLNMQELLNNDIPINDKRRWQLTRFEDEAIDFNLMAEMANHIGVIPTNREIDDQSKKMWRNLNISNSDDAKKWMDANCVSDKQWIMFAIKLALRQCARNWFKSTSGSIQTVPLAVEYALLNNL